MESLLVFLSTRRCNPNQDSCCFWKTQKISKYPTRPQGTTKKWVTAQEQVNRPMEQQKWDTGLVRAGRKSTTDAKSFGILMLLQTPLWTQSVAAKCWWTRGFGAAPHTLHVVNHALPLSHGHADSRRPGRAKQKLPQEPSSAPRSCLRGPR